MPPVVLVVSQAQAKGSHIVFAPRSDDAASAARIDMASPVSLHVPSSGDVPTSRRTSFMSPRGGGGRVGESSPSRSSDQQESRSFWRERYEEEKAKAQAQRIEFEQAMQERIQGWIERVEESLKEQIGLRVAELHVDLEQLRVTEREQRDGLEQLKSNVDHLGVDVRNVSLRLRDERQRVANAADHAVRASGKLDEVSGTLYITREGFQKEVERVGKAVQALWSEVKSVHQEHEAAHRATAERGDCQELAGDVTTEDRSRLAEVAQRLEETVDVQTHLMRTIHTLQKHVQGLPSEVEFGKLQTIVGSFESRQNQFEKYVTDQLFTVRKDQTKQVLETWTKKWGPFKRRQAMAWVFAAWVEFRTRRARIREAISQTKRLYAGTHVRSRVRAWWYTMQKDTLEQELDAISRAGSNHEVKLEMLQAAAHRHERAVQEQARGIQHRLLAAEKALEIVQTTKADKDEVFARLEAIEKRIVEDLDLDPLRKVDAELRAGVVRLEVGKMDVFQGEEDRRKVEAIATEFRHRLRQQEDFLHTRASVSDLQQKADAKRVEEVLVLLAQQSDQLAQLMAADLEQIRRAMTRFLEISPDIRKAALSLGIDPNERCLTCRTGQRKLEPVTGSDGSVYRMSPDCAQTIPEQTQRILTDKLKLPGMLMSSLVAGTAVNHQALASPIGQSTEELSTSRPVSVRGSKEPVPRSSKEPVPQAAVTARMYFPAVVAGDSSARGNETPRSLSKGSRRLMEATAPSRSVTPSG